MFKKVFASILAIAIAFTMIIPIGGSIDVKANDVETYALVREEQRTMTKRTYTTASYNNRTASVPIVINLTYTRFINGTSITYSNFSAELEPTDDATYQAFYAKAVATPKITRYSSTKTIYVTGEANVYYNSGTTQNVFVKKVAYSLEFVYE